MRKLPSTIPPTHIFTMACPTMPVPLVDASIRRCEIMPILALDLLGILGRGTLTTRIIFTIRDSFQVTWLDACPITAQMVSMKTLWNRADAKLVDDPLHTSALIFRVLDVLGVTVFIKMALPDPAPTFHLDQMAEREIFEFRSGFQDRDLNGCSSRDPWKGRFSPWPGASSSGSGFMLLFAS